MTEVMVVSDLKRSAEEQRRVKELLDHIHKNCGRISAIKDLADNEDECKRLFRKYLNTTPMEYLRQYRMKLACQLLTQTKNSITEISAECGMNNSYLCKRIREETGMTPLEYRRAYYRNQTEQK